MFLPSWVLPCSRQQHRPSFPSRPWFRNRPSSRPTTEKSASWGHACEFPTDSSTDHFTKLGKLFHQLGIVPLVGNVLDVAVGPVVDVGAIVATHEVTDLNFLSINEHTIELFNGSIGSFGSFVMDVSVSLGLSSLAIRHNLARENVSKETKGIVELLVVNRLVKVLDKDVTDTGTTERGITLTPHDAAGLALDHGVVHGVEGALGIGQLMKVDVGVTKRATGDGITADTNGGDGSDGVENLKQETLVHIWGKIADVKRGGMERLSLSGGTRRHGGSRRHFSRLAHGGSAFRVGSSWGRHGFCLLFGE